MHLNTVNLSFVLRGSERPPLVDSDQTKQINRVLRKSEARTQSEYRQILGNVVYIQE